MEFLPLTTEHAASLGAVLRRYGAKLCDYSFASLYMWAEVYKTSWLTMDDICLLRWREPHTGEIFYTVPHRGAELWRALDLLFEMEGGVCTLWGLPKEVCDEIVARFGDRATVSSHPEEADYLYEINDLSAMAGRSFSAKRNHIHAFLREHPDYIYEELTAENLPAVRAFYTSYRKTEEDDSDTSHEEGRAVWRLLDAFCELPIEGGVLWAEGRIAGFFIGEVQGDVLFLHVEKALRELRGAYPLLVRETARRYAGRVRYENREEDDGDEGLRQSKLSYRPIELAEKFTVRLIK